MNDYSLIRSYLSKEETEELKVLAKSKGMTLTGLRDSLCREALKRRQDPNPRKAANA